MVEVRVDTEGRVREHDDVDGMEGASLVMPGFVNAHSHAFQRALRGRVEVRGSGEHAHDDFWSWRSAMYADSGRVGVDDVFALAAWAYADMLRAGFVAVGEFHYLHRAGPIGGGVDDDPLATSRAIARAARTVGIELVLLETAYARGGFGRPLGDAQRRFSFDDVGAFLDHARRARDELESGPGVHVGLAIHSVRACPRGWIEAIARRAVDDDVVLHVHACEQRRELEECRAEHGMSPVALLEATGALTPRTTVVHATHLDDDDIARLARSGASVCLTPSTERNLGDGLCRIADLHAAGVPLCIGTDSHARIDVADELRSLEDHERLRLERRNVLAPPGGRLGQALIPCGTKHGARALGLRSSSSTASVPLPLEGAAGGGAVALDAWLVGGSSRDVDTVTVDGREVVRAGRLTLADDADIERRAVDVLRRLV